MLTEVNGASISEDALFALPPPNTCLVLSSPSGDLVLFKSLASSLLPAASFQLPLHGAVLLLTVSFPPRPVSRVRRRDAFYGGDGFNRRDFTMQLYLFFWAGEFHWEVGKESKEGKISKEKKKGLDELV